MSATATERLLLRRMAAGCRQFDLINDGDHILVGLSGGKDSLTLLHLLGIRQRVRVPSIHVEAVHVRMEGIDYECDTSYLQQFADAAGVALHIRHTTLPTRQTAIDASLTPTDNITLQPEGAQHAKPTCFLCSWARRKVLFNLAQELGCNKIALGHHQDDILRTALMNLTFQGSFATMPALLEMRRMPLTIIRPLCLTPESLIATWAAEQHYEPLRHSCPYEHLSNRTAISSVFDAMQQLSPDARGNLWQALCRAGKLVERKNNL